MKVLAAVLAVVVAAVVGIAVLAMLNLQALIGAHRDQLVARVERIVGRPITVGAVEPSWWPLGIRLRTVTLGEDPAFGPGPFLVADGVIMSVRAWPLVHGRIEAAGVVLEHPELTLRRDGGGEWNVASLGNATRDDDGVGSRAGKHKDRRRGFRIPLEWAIGVALSQVRDGTVTLEDQRDGGATQLVLRHVRLHADDVRLGASARVRLEAAVFAPDKANLLLEVRVPNLGEHDVEHSPFTARLELTDADLGAVGAWLRRREMASGRVRSVTLDASGTLDALHASLDLHADDPAIRVGSVPLGAAQPVTLQARVERTGRTLTIEMLHGTLDGLTVQGHGAATEDPWRIALDVQSESGGVAALAVGDTSVEVSAIGGKVTVDREGLALEPLRLTLAGVALEARGWVTGVAPPALDLRIVGRPFDGTIAADLTIEPTGAARARVEAGTIDLAAAMVRLAPDLRGRIEGRASGAAVVTARYTNGALVAGSLGGNGSVTVDHGKLRDVNLPDLLVEQIERVPLMPQLVSARTRARYTELFGSRDTVVESATMPFTIAHGRLTIDRAVFDNPAYQITGNGWIDEAQQLRFRGTVLLGAGVSKTLRDDVRAAKYLATDDGRVTLPFVARGQLGKVRVEPDAKRLRSRGLTALLGKSAAGAQGMRDDDDKNDDGNERRAPRRDEPIEDRVIERLERMLHP